MYKKKRILPIKKTIIFKIFQKNDFSKKTMGIISDNLIAKGTFLLFNFE